MISYKIWFSLVGRLCIFSFLILNEKKVKKFFYNNFGVQGVIAFFNNSSKPIGIFLDA